MKSFIPIFSLLLASTVLAGPKYIESTKRLSQDHSYFQSGGATDYWKLAPYYLPQHNSKACSVASVTMILNALRADTELTSSDELFTSEKLLKMNSAFTKAVGKTGKGMDLDSLRENVETLLEKQFPGKYTVTLHRFDREDKAAQKKALVELLAKNEGSQRDFIIVNFLQGVLTGDPEGMVGHISPIAAFDVKSDRVLIFDTDRQYYEPYWVSVEKLLEAMNTQDKDAKKSRGLIHVSPRTEVAQLQ